MNGDTELLNFIFQNSQMGADTINRLLDIVEDNREFKDKISAQKEGYRSINETAKELLKNHGYDEKGINSFEKIKTYVMINMQTMSDKSASHIAEMLIIGSNMGIIDSIKKQRQYSDADKKILDLMHKLQKFEEGNVGVLKEFL